MRIIRLALAAILAALPAFADAPLFLRKTAKTDGTTQLETCIRHYQPAAGKGPDIYLVSVSHIGDTNYFAAIQKNLDAQMLVLFEGVGRDGAAERGAASNTNRAKLKVGGKQIDPSALQTKLADTLGLVFQLDAINYDRPNFRNCDISVTSLKDRLQGQDIDGDELMKMLGGKSDLLNTALALISTDARSRALVKCVLVELLAEIGNDLEGFAAQNPALENLMTVLLTERNDTVFNGLKTELARKDPPASIAMFYGAAHMKNLSARIEKDLNYRAADEQWLPAFGVNAAAAGVTQQEITMIRALMQMAKQLKLQQPAK